jgi:type VI secretion system secreted protein VgrG
MAATYTQEGHRIAVASPLGKDQLLLTDFTGEEALSRLFSYELQMLSPVADIAAKDIVGKGLTWLVQIGDREPRYFHGLVSRWRVGPKTRDLRQYRAEVVPWLWLLTRTADCRIFQNKTAPEIVELIFKEMGFTDYENGVRETYPRREYCVQYRESDFTFVSRLLEQEGIWYYFRHEEGKHTLVLADQIAAYQDGPEKVVGFHAGADHRGHLTGWEHRYELRSGKWAETDYNFETPSTDLLTKSTTTVALPGNTRYEVFDYPGEYADKAAGTARTRLRMEEEEVEHDVVAGTSTCSTFSPGYRFQVSAAEDDNPEAGQAFVVTSISHSASDNSYLDGDRASDTYANRFTCIPDSVSFRPARTTPRPMIGGTQTAVVVGPPGEEIHTDKHGRIKVQFHWDRLGQLDQKSSCWVRVATSWGGKGWGFIQIPRIGHEVVVSFLEGNPDRPLVTGSVYNAESMPAKGLPGAMRISGLKTNSTPGGGGANELTFDDTKGKEMVHLHAQFDMTGKVEHDDTHEVGHDRSDTIDHDETLHVLHDRAVTVDHDHTETVAHDQSMTIQHDRKANVAHDDSETVGNDQTQWVGGMRNRIVMKNETVNVVGDRVRIVSQCESVTVLGNRTVAVPGGVHLLRAAHVVVAAGDENIVVNGDRKKSVHGNELLTVGGNLAIGGSQNIVVEAGVKLELRGPGGSITIDGDGVTIEGTLVKIN